ncbi:sn-glycerol-1-phosphate dehydrogenase [Salsuginibacillus kocurii]|uniref:sn-glycerol-1-phosphate dehydrogenase n=1 Tax=Salsuginibacillus kocurii TaxID=427078 RepID=UPI000369196A|nr:sn-glycerol-1-phosphate dehydrogenase [Salsuginibacillus kocurii]
MKHVRTENLNDSIICNCHSHHVEELSFIISRGAIANIPAYLIKHNFKNVLIVCDEKTYEAAGSTLCALLENERISYKAHLLPKDILGQVVADERTLNDLFTHTTTNVKALLAVGTGTIHDIVRYVSHKTQIPFLSVPTAASVDGFTSTGAPLLLQGRKVTIQASSPVALFADLNILQKSPPELNGAGFGDMVGKFTSLADWKFSALINNETFCENAYKITEQALHQCLNHVDKIARNRPQGLYYLMEALIYSGLAMLLVGNSKPASGAEHHLSHMIEMQAVNTHKPQMLHGNKVGVATLIMTKLYKKLAMDESIPTQYKNPYLTLPNPGFIENKLATVGCPTKAHQLGLSNEELLALLLQASTIRDRYTGLKYLNDHSLTRKYFEDLNLGKDESCFLF